MATHAQLRNLTEETLGLVRDQVEADLLGAPTHWGPLHVAALVARAAVRLATSTPHGRKACAAVEDR